MPLWVRVLIALCLPLLFCDTGHAQEYRWNFNEAGSSLHWKAIHASVEQGSSGVVITRGDDTFWFVSPPNLNIPPRVTYVEFRLKAPATYLLGYLVMKTVNNQTWQEEFQLGLPDRFNVYRVNMREGDVGNSPIDSFAFAFGGLGLDKVELDYVRCYEPSFLQLARIRWMEFWSAGYARAATVNFIDMPFVGEVSLLALLYIFILSSIVCAIAALRAVNMAALRKALIISFVLAGILFALRMDYGWYWMWRLDRSTLSQRTYEERVALVDATGSYEFAGMVRKLIPPDASVRIECGTLAEKIKYYLLPLKASEHGRYVIVCSDSGITYDPDEKVLKRGEAVVADRAFFMQSLRKDFFLYRLDGMMPQ
ncbi:MAG TPA: hypothetical protein VFG09_10970 [Thermodesulfovibrionales bacterium]|nr:hypothetical protein [Thermodesulfovibrionales bacterium]